MISIKDFKSLTPQKALAYCLLVAIGWLVSRIEKGEERAESSQDQLVEVLYKKIEVLESENKNIKSENRDLNGQVNQSNADCLRQLQAKDQEYIRNLKEQIALQQRVNERAAKTEKIVEVLPDQIVTKITQHGQK